VYDICAAGETGFLKGHTFTPNHIYVSRSTDGGQSWTASLVYALPPGSSFANIFPALAVDPINGKLYAAFSDGEQPYFSSSSDQGMHWSPAIVVNTAPADAAISPWVAAYNGTVDVVYYATDSDGADDPSAVWNVYMAQAMSDGASFTQSLVSNSPNHFGEIRLEGSACDPNARMLLDLFEVSINPQNGKAAIIDTDDTLTTDADSNPLPQILLAVVWSDMRNSQLPVPIDPYEAVTNSDVIVSQPMDGGMTWSAPQALAVPNDQFIPWAAYDAGGLLRIGYFDRSYDAANHMYGYTLATETGQASLTVAMTQVTTALSDPTQNTRWFSGSTPNPHFPPPTTFPGDYSSIAAGPADIASYWTDMRETVCFGGRCGAGEDAYYASTP
jgi:hypothetical protein